MNARILATLTWALLVSPNAFAGITYRLNQPSLFDAHPFGYSGTITTNGSTGVLSTVDFIESWSITVITPSTLDGVTSEVLTRSNSSLMLDIGGVPGLLITPDAISMQQRAARTPYAFLTWETPGDATKIQFTNRFTDEQGLNFGVTVFDPSEPNHTLGIVGEGFPIASAVPVPYCAHLAVIILSLASFRRWRAPQPTGRW